MEQEYSPKAIEAQLRGKEISLYLTVYGQEVVGYLMARPICGGVCLGIWLAVSDDHQKQGIASKLLKMWEEDAKKAGMHNLQLWCDKRNIEFYKNRGFKLAGLVPANYYGHDDYLFYKVIQRPLEKNYLRSK